MKNKVLSFFIAISLISSVFGVSTLLSSCATTKSTYEAGAVVGGILAGTVTEIYTRAAVEAAEEGRPVIYQSNDGYQRIEESPVSYNAETKCHKVRERIWQEGQLVKDEVKEVCESERTEPTY